ncbi:hypothetical protein MTR67_046665 [Solanum verrucosum]|uniref:Uncharacterized protein n=1 Tax=Solanum verrucosum TaxID=315347 RepID=A0AAF0UWD8_SOLVR|nr:hypothetical protein MTR67_046665 [Solanum verrucosum]
MAEENWQKDLSGAAAQFENWEKQYSYEEKRLKSLIDGEGYGNWEKQNCSWEIEKGLVPSPEEVTEDQKKQKEAWDKRLLELSTKILTEEEKKLKESYIENWHVPGWDLAYHTKSPKFPTLQLPPSETRQKVPPTPDDLQFLCRKHQPIPEISLEDRREKLAALGRCIDGSYLTPYCRCDKKCCRFDTTLEDYPPEYLPIWLAYCRQYRQSHCFDIDDFINGRIGPLNPSQNFNGRAELLMELANHSIKDYNEKECNVFKYKVMKIEKVNCCEATCTYWMTVKVSNLTLGSIETFQIHAGMRWVTNDKIIFCCRPKEEVTIGLPSCQFCFGLLPWHVTEGKEP